MKSRMAEMMKSPSARTDQGWSTRAEGLFAEGLFAEVMER